MAKVQSLRGMNDILPQESAQWQYVENILKQTLDSYGIEEIRLPVVEKSELFHRGVGAETDIIEKETYDFHDRNHEALTLRPEGTAGCVRAMIEHGLLRNQTRKVWYSGPMYRYERPQKGRYRQFYQLGIEYFGFSGVAIEAELLLAMWRLWQNLGLSPYVTLELNTLGTAANREAYAAALRNYLLPYRDQLDHDSQRRLDNNPLRILDSKHAATRALLADAPRMADHIAEATMQDFQSLSSFLREQGLPVRHNANLVRGLDYYTHTVFEWTTDRLGAQSTLCAGGRYDALVEQLGGPATPAIGLAMGMERLILVLQTAGCLPEATSACDIYLITAGEAAIWHGLSVAEQLREARPDLCIHCNTAATGFKAQFKKADKYGARLAVIIGEDELARQVYSVKFLREDRPQQQLDLNQLLNQL